MIKFLCSFWFLALIGLMLVLLYKTVLLLQSTHRYAGTLTQVNLFLTKCLPVSRESGTTKNQHVIPTQDFLRLTKLIDGLHF